MTEGTQRRLTTIVAADIAGFSRLVGNDEEGTLAAQRNLRTELIEPLLAEHHGRIANTAGDSFLFEFPSAVEAVRCSMAVQDGIAERNCEIPTDRRIEYRIGINVGDVVTDGNDLLGDGVNIAARLENICEPGGIVLSDDAYRQVRDRIDLAWEDGGEHEVKNIARPVRVWRWSNNLAPKVVPSINAPLVLPDKPSIAVLPFDNMSGDLDQEYFADGITEDIITALSRLSNMRVIARNSTFVYKGLARDLREVAGDLGVQYILEGSVRRSGNRIRISAQLIDATNGSHVWADRFDRIVNDIFEIQDQITKEIVSALRVRLTDGELAAVLNRETENIDAWQLCVEATESLAKYDIVNFQKARQLANKALELDPKFAHAYAVVGHSYWGEARQGNSDQEKELYEKAYKFGQKSIEINPSSPWGYTAKGTAAAGLGFMEEAVETISAGLTINPGNADLLLSSALVTMKKGNFRDAATRAEAALHHNPFPPGSFYSVLGRAYEGSGQLQAAVEICNRGLQEHPDFFALLMNKANLLARQGNLTESKKVMARFRESAPHFRNSQTRRYLFIDDQKYCDRYVEGLKLAGLPD
jgi:adenylate cyclase